jgi:hypothetical protein
MPIPRTELDARYSEPDARPTSWEAGRRLLEQAELYWLSTVRPDGRPHVTPLLAVWLADRAVFCTGPQEQKARNLAANPACALTTGTTTLHGLDVVLTGTAVRVIDDRRLQPIAAAYLAKYGHEWAFTVDGGAFVHQDGGEALVFEIVPSTVHGFAKGAFSQTRWTF